MILRRPLLLGIDNPHSTNPREALLWAKAGSTGRRLFDIVGLSEAEYEEKLERRNACDLSVRTLETLARRSVIVLGHEAWRKIGLSRAPLFTEHRAEDMFSTFTLVPHPSGKNLYYNEAVNVARVRGLILRKITHWERNR